jgi:hypothetical protein
MGLPLFFFPVSLDTEMKTDISRRYEVARYDLGTGVAGCWLPDPGNWQLGTGHWKLAINWHLP